MNLTASDDVLKKIASYTSGDARSAYNVLEVAAGLAQKNAQGELEITDEIVRDALQKRILLYDKTGEEHYNLISALHKSVRNSDPDAALYWLGRMLEAGEDPLYVARRVVRMAVEDIGLADPNALSLCMAARDAVDFIGMPEGNLALAQAVVYLSVAPKSNALYTAYGEVQHDVEQTAADAVPLHLRNAPTRLMKGLGYGQGYQYAHDLEAKVADMQCLPDNLSDRVYYQPTNEGIEKRIRERLEEIKRQRSRASEGSDSAAKERIVALRRDILFASVSVWFSRLQQKAGSYGYASQCRRQRNSSRSCSARRSCRRPAARAKGRAENHVDSRSRSTDRQRCQRSRGVLRMPGSEYLSARRRSPRDGAGRRARMQMHHGKGHRLKIGREGMVGYVASTGQMRYAPDVRKDQYYIGVRAERSRRWRFHCAWASNSWAFSRRRILKSMAFPASN